MEKEKLLSPYQQKILERDYRICKEFVRLKAEHITSTNWSICAKIEEITGVKRNTVAGVVRKNGLYT